MSDKKGILLINLGTPDSPSTSDVRKYLSEFLNDPRVIDLPWMVRKILVNCIIVPFRAKGSAKLYQHLWTDNGAPLLYNTRLLTEAVSTKLGPEYSVRMAMRYGQPSMKSIVQQFIDENIAELTVLPLYPQYATSTTGSTFEELERIIALENISTPVTLLGQFYDHPKFIMAFSEVAKQYSPDSFDHIIFSFHGIPIRQVKGVKNEIFVLKNGELASGQLPYPEACERTARSIANHLGLSEASYSISFQSRLSSNWLAPFTDEVIVDRAKSGDERLLVFSPSFVADCLETTVEIGIEYRELFQDNGGKELQLVESLNDHPTWVDCVVDLVK